MGTEWMDCPHRSFHSILCKLCCHGDTATSIPLDLITFNLIFILCLWNGAAAKAHVLVVWAKKATAGDPECTFDVRFKTQHPKPSMRCFRAHSNGSIRRGFKTDTSEPLTVRSGLGVNLKDVTVFNRGREKGVGPRRSHPSSLPVFTAACHLCNGSHGDSNGK